MYCINPTNIKTLYYMYNLYCTVYVQLILYTVGPICTIDIVYTVKYYVQLIMFSICCTVRIVSTETTIKQIF